MARLHSETASEMPPALAAALIRRWAAPGLVAHSAVSERFAAADSSWLLPTRSLQIAIRFARTCAADKVPTPLPLEEAVVPTPVGALTLPIALETPPAIRNATATPAPAATSAPSPELASRSDNHPRAEKKAHANPDSTKAPPKIAANV